MSVRRIIRPAAVGAAALAAAGALLLAPPAYAVPEAAQDLGTAPAPAVATARATTRALDLRRQVARREQALTAIFAVAARHARDVEERSDRLAALGYSGDLPALEHILPLRGYHLSAGFGSSGPLWESTHTGLDFGAPSGTGLVAVADGTVTEVGYAGSYGLRTVLTLEDGTDLWYCHQSLTLAAPGQVLEIGEPVGHVGSTGNSTGPHLHLEVHPGGGAAIDPAAWLVSVGMTP